METRTFSAWLTRKKIHQKTVDFEDYEKELKNLFNKMFSVIDELDLHGIEKRRTIAIDGIPKYDLIHKQKGFVVYFDVDKIKNKAVAKIEMLGLEPDAYFVLEKEDAQSLFGSSATIKNRVKLSLFGEQGVLNKAVQSHRNNLKETHSFMLMEGFFRTFYLLAMEADKINTEHIADELLSAGYFKGVDPEENDVFERFLSMCTASIRTAIMRARRKETGGRKYNLPQPKATLEKE